MCLQQIHHYQRGLYSSTLLTSNTAEGQAINFFREVENNKSYSKMVKGSKYQTQSIDKWHKDQNNISNHWQDESDYLTKINRINKTLARISGKTKFQIHKIIDENGDINIRDDYITMNNHMATNLITWNKMGRLLDLNALPSVSHEKTEYLHITILYIKIEEVM